jgi:two-component system CheB/CheR fusion protein
MEGDPTRLAQVLANLLNNALKFTGPGGHVTVSVTRHASCVVRPDDGIPTHDTQHTTHDRVAVSVADTGIGIPAELLPYLFQSFTQGDRSLDRSRGGLGLGLALVKGLTELHDGRVQARSDGLGQGAEFTVLLPAAATGGPPLAETRSAIRSPRSEIGRRILVVDDNRDSAETLRDLLELSGYAVEIAHSGPAGVAAARASLPDVILCDIGLPGMDGYTVAAELRRHPTTAPVCLIAVTGYGQEEDRRRSAAAGFDHHLVKPVDLGELQELLASLAVTRE